MNIKIGDAVALFGEDIRTTDTGIGIITDIYNKEGDMFPFRIFWFSSADYTEETVEAANEMWQAALDIRKNKDTISL